MLEAVKMKKSHFLRDQITFNQAGLLKYVQSTMSDLRLKMDSIKDDSPEAEVCC